MRIIHRLKPGGDFEIVQIPQLISATFPIPLENILDFTPHLPCATQF